MSEKDLEGLQNGLYEKIITQTFQEKLDQALKENQIWADREDLDAQEAVSQLSAYIRQVISWLLKDIADADDSDTSAKKEIDFINRLITFLFKDAPEQRREFSVADTKSLLLFLQHQRNAAKKLDIPRPNTSLSQSFLFTNSKKDAPIATELYAEIASADQIDLLVSFIKFSGISMILPALKEFTYRGGKLRVITTTYMGATDPKAVRVLSQLPNTEIKISYDVKSTRLHAKSYIFRRNSGYSTAYIGSSNLSHAAITEGLEWNMKITAQDMPMVFQKMNTTFDVYWNSDNFEVYTADQEAFLQQEIDAIRHPASADNGNLYSFRIRPYPYQQTILDNLEAERTLRNRWKNLVVAATGTGKTAIAAFDYARFAKSRLPRTTNLLFVAHREEILKQSLSCFRQILQEPDWGELDVGNNHASRLAYRFASIQTLNRQNFWDRIDPDYYDMIVIDEFHHAAAASYQKLLSHFKPKILLGLTATPERMDGKDITKYFDNHISAEIRLADAIEQRLLCPFHYFGAEDPIDLSDVKWSGGDYDISDLERKYVIDIRSAVLRAGAVLSAVDRYTADIRDVKGLGFCVSKKHAKYMADYMTARGVPSMNLDSDTPETIRNNAKEKLENGTIRFIFTVDLFNEGVDIPAVNTVLFLRPTNSLTVFLQQLGRGLRLSEGKNCLTVLDFVAQGNRKYDFSGRLYSLLGRKDTNLEAEIKGHFPHAPKGCFIQLTEMAQKRILENIKNQTRGTRFYADCLRDLYESEGRIPSLSKFLETLRIPAEVFYNKKRLYSRLCASCGLSADLPETEEETVLRRAMPHILSIDSPQWLAFLRKQFLCPAPPRSDWDRKFLRMWQYTLYGKEYTACGMKDPLEAIRRFAAQPTLRQEILDVLAYQSDRTEVIAKPISLPGNSPLELHSRYTRDQLFAALGYKSPASIREGVKYLEELKTDVFLVTLNKSSKEFSDSTLYEDYSINSTLFHWQTQNSVTPESRTGQRYIHQKSNGTTVLFFVRERKKDGHGNSMSYTFLGPAKYVSHTGRCPMTIIYELAEPIPAQYIAVTDSSGVI